MASGTRSKSTDGRISEQKRFDVVIKAIKKSDEKIKSLQKSLETEKLRLTAFSKLVQLHQGGLNVSSTNVPQDQFVQWLGVVPDVNSMETLTRRLEKDLSVTRQFSGCRIKDYRAVNLDVNENTIHKLYEAVLEIESFKVQLAVESKLQVMTGEEAMWAVQRLVCTPPLPQLQPLLQHVAATRCLYMLPRALQTLLALEADQREVIVWSPKMRNLEVTSTKLRLTLNYVPLSNLRQEFRDVIAAPKLRAREQKKRKAPQNHNQSRRLAVVIKREPLGSPEVVDTESSDSPETIDIESSDSSEIVDIVSSDSPESVDLEYEKDACVTLRWVVTYCPDISNFRHRFNLNVPQSVLERYSRSPVLPFLNGDQVLLSPGDVIRLFSSLTH